MLVFLRNYYFHSGCFLLISRCCLFFIDTDEPIISGTGKVSKECLDTELDKWNDLLAKWTDTKTRPKQLTTLVRQGIPEALRGEVWQRLTINEKDDELLNNYRILISKVSRTIVFCRKFSSLFRDLIRM